MKPPTNNNFYSFQGSAVTSHNKEKGNFGGNASGSGARGYFLDNSEPKPIATQAERAAKAFDDNLRFMDYPDSRRAEQQQLEYELAKPKSLFIQSMQTRDQNSHERAA